MQVKSLTMFLHVIQFATLFTELNGLTIVLILSNYTIRSQCVQFL